MAACLGCWDLLVTWSFNWVREGTKRGWGGVRGDTGGWLSANRVVGASDRVRLGSAADIVDGCGALWWSSIQRASMASEVSWTHWSIRAAISWRRFAAWFRRVSSKLCREERDAAWR